MEINESQLIIPHSKNRSVFQYRMSWARTRLKNAKLIINVERGKWQCTKEGYELENLKANVINSLSRRKSKLKELIDSEDFTLVKMIIEYGKREILNIDYTLSNEDSSIKTREKDGFKNRTNEIRDLNSFSIITSDNGAGKSFALARLCEIFNEYDKFIRNQSETNTMKYDYYSLEYIFGRDRINLRYFEESWSMYKDDKKIMANHLNYLPKSVIAITHTIGDKLPFNEAKNNKKIKGTYCYLGPKTKKDSIDLSTKSINLIKNISSVFNLGDISIISKILQYINYDEKIVISGPNYTFEKLQKKYSQSIYNNEKSIVNKGRQIRRRDASISEYTLIPSSFKDEDINVLGRVANELIVLANSCPSNQNNNLKVYLYKNIEKIDYEALSSGEVVVIETLLSIAAYIDRESIILIDEPENSLHPKWQSEFIPLINKLFPKDDYKYHCVIATHSPNIVLQLGDLNSTIIKIIENKGIREYYSEQKDTDNKTVEEVLYYDFSSIYYRSIPLQEDMIKIIDYIEKRKKVDNIYLDILKRLEKFTEDISQEKSLYKFYKEALKYKKGFTYD